LGEFSDTATIESKGPAYSASVAQDDRILGMVEAALNDFDQLSASGAARRALRVATLLDDKPAAIWLRREGEELADDDLKPDVQAKVLADLVRNELAHLPRKQAFSIVVSDFAAYLGRRKIDGTSSILIALQDIERHITLVEGEAAQLVSQVPSSKVYQATMQARVTMNRQRALLGHTKDAIFEYLLGVEKRMVFETAAEDIFARVKQRVDAAVSVVSREALDQFSSAYERLAVGDAEALSHALLSCRRILKSVADVVYPARNEPVIAADGKERRLTDERYINRLLQFISEHVGRHGSGEVLQANLTMLGARLSAIDGLASKGVHASVTVAEVEVCIVQTYLAIGEIIGISFDISGTHSAD
jgi:hypothetical protein